MDPPPRPGGPLNLKFPPQTPTCKPCIDPPDWFNDPQLSRVKECDIRNYRQCRLQRYLEHLVNRLPNEPFGAFIGRCFETADQELNFNNHSKQCIGDKYPHVLDRYVSRLWLGAKLKVSKNGVYISADEELVILQLLREECNELYEELDICPMPHVPQKCKWNHLEKD